MGHKVVSEGDRVRLVENRKLGDISGETGIVLKVNPKTVAILMDVDVDKAGDHMIRKADLAAYMRGETVRNMQGGDFRNTVTEQPGPIGVLVSFYQLAESWAALVYPQAIAEVLGGQED